MEWTGLNELREQFLTFFQGKEHYRMDSFPLVPQDDKSLLLINSGMAPLKKYFLGQAKVPGNRATTCQKCIRTPDIERVGKTARHGTFFEMLGNFSFGDYFKREATRWAWEFITEVIKMPVDRLYVSVFEEDDEAYDIWTKEIGVAPDHMVHLGREDNFWEIGSGPCGPCSEIYFDRGVEHGCGKPDCAVGCDCDRFVEFWNLVFTQFISDGNGNYERMEHPNIDTGMGLERLACICQGVNNLFEVDTVQNIMKHIERIAGVEYKKDEKVDVSLRVITDHIRSTVFMVGDGVGPSNEGRGYVLRRLLRRAARHGRLPGITRPFLFEVCDTVVEENKTAYPNLAEHKDYIKKVIKAEEERFAKTIDAGFDLLNSILDEMAAKGETVLAGETAFKLSDTLGFPLDLTKEIVEERGCTVDEEGFTLLLNEQKKRARDDAKSRDVSWESDLFKDLGHAATEFVGYDTLSCDAKLLFIANNEGAAETASEGETVKLILDKTPFYAESGGQVADNGTIQAGACTIEVFDCQKTNEGYYVHTGVVKAGVVETGADVKATVNAETRNATMRNHTSAHLLQAALREVLGDHVHQAGSYVDPNRVRFDFSHFEAMKPEEIKRVERIVNSRILMGQAVSHKTMALEEAKKLGAMALFGEKYGDVVRVIEVPGFSIEFCGGTHVTNTGNIGLFKILSESSVAAGVRRIEGTTGMGVMDYMDEQESLIRSTAAAFKLTNVNELADKAKAALAEQKELQHEIERLNAKLAGASLNDILANAKTVGDVQVFSGVVADAGADALRSLADDIKAKYPMSVTLLGTAAGGKVTLCAACGADAVKAGFKAGVIVKEAAALVGGSGGGKPDLAMAGGKDASKLNDAVNAAADIVAKQK